MANYLEMPEAEFEAEYVVQRSKFGKRFRYTAPCRFWTQGLCAIHEAKPAGCACYAPLPPDASLPDLCAQYHKNIVETRTNFQPVEV